MTFDPRPAAKLLAEAWRSGHAIDTLADGIRPSNVNEGYDIQDLFMAEIAQPIVGWKLGLGSAPQKVQTGVGRAIAGRILGSHLFKHGDSIPVPKEGAAVIEFEIGFVLGRDIRPDEGAFPVMDAVSEVCVTYEIVFSRFKDRIAAGFPSFAADNGAFHALVLGPKVESVRLGFLAQTLTVSANGEAMAGAIIGDLATDPTASFADLIAVAKERGMVLPKGSIISTGTLSKPFTVSGPETVLRAQFMGQELACTLKAG
jgi:2-keto-4-pentenoate hydratase